MKKMNIYQIFNIICLCMAVVLSVFEIVKIIIYSTHRPLTNLDYGNINGSLVLIAMSVALFVFWCLYNNKSRFRKTAFGMLIVCMVFVLVKVYSKIKTFSVLYFPTEVYTPPFIDKFTSLFELCFVSLFAIYLIFVFIFTLKKKHFRRLS